MEWRQGEYRISDERSAVDLDVVYGFLSTSYWSEGVPRDVVARSIDYSLPFSLWWEPAGEPPRQVAFARAVTDRATYAYVADVFVIEEFRGRGLSKWLMKVMVEHSELQGLRRWTLLTRDAHALYGQVGFTPIAKPDRYMERHDPEVYKKP
jgi:GNAT superfamily N-acetyltransferase